MARHTMQLDPDRARRAREQRGMTIRDVVAKTSLSNHSVGKAENSGRVTVSTARKLAEAYGVGIPLLVPREDRIFLGRED